MLHLTLASALTLCAPVAEFAKELMVARQAGVPLAQALTVSTQPTMQALIVSAYRKPRYTTEAYRERTVVEFANETLIACLDLGEKE